MVIENGGGREEWDWKIGDRSWQKILSSTLCVCVHGMSRWHNLECALWCVLLVFGLDKVFTLRFLWFMHFPLSCNQNGKGRFADVSSAMTYSLLRFCIILGYIKIFTNFISIMWGKGGAFHGLLSLYTFGRYYKALQPLLLALFAQTISRQNIRCSVSQGKNDRTGRDCIFHLALSFSESSHQCSRGDFLKKWPHVVKSRYEEISPVLSYSTSQLPNVTTKW